jgi:putative membrane protein
MLYLDWQLEPVLLGGMAALAVAYYLAVGPLRKRLAPGTPYPTGRASVFGLGLVLLFLNEGSPLHDLAERYLLSAHMVQHLALSYVVAPVLLVGVPAWLFRALLGGRRVLPIARVVLHPLVTFVTFALVLAIYHLPPMYDLSLSHTSIHHAIHFAVLLVSLMLWWPLLSPLEELPRPAYPLRLVYLFLAPVAQLPIFAGVTFSPDTLYAAYANMPVRAYGLEPLEDQALAGAIMKVSGLIAFGAPFVFTFFAWYRSELAPPAPEGGAPEGGAPKHAGT